MSCLGGPKINPGPRVTASIGLIGLIGATQLASELEQARRME